MNEVTLLKVGNHLIVPIQTELHDKAIKQLQENILNKIEETSVTGLIIDISGVMIVDSFMARVLSETAKMAQLMGVNSVLVGMKKEVVITIMQLGIVVKNLKVASNIEDAMQLLRNLDSQNDQGNG